MSKTLDQHLADLRALAQGLNEQSDKLQAVINKINGQVKSLNIGLEAWAPTKIGEARVGYARVDNKWGLCIENGEGRHLLDNAKRKERIEAMPLIPEVLVALTDAAEKMIVQMSHANSEANAVLQAMQRGGL